MTAQDPVSAPPAPTSTDDATIGDGRIQRGAGGAIRLDPLQGLQLLAEHTSEVVCLSDARGRISWISPAVRGQLGWAPEELVGRDLADLTFQADQPSLAALNAQLRKGTSASAQLRMRTARGATRWMGVTARPADADAAGLGVVSCWRDIQPEVEARRQLEKALRTDPLTGLASRMALIAELEERLAQPSGGGGVLAVLSVGIDRLSAVNDALTQRAGDLLLLNLATRLATVVAQPNLVARGTGGTFLVLLDGLGSIDAASTTAESLRQACKGSVVFAGQDLTPTVSIGIAIAEPGQSADELLRDAHLAMRQATALGRDRWEFGDRQASEEARRGLAQQSAIRSALAADAFKAWFMPVVSIAEGQLIGYEALVRWVQADGTVQAPDSFLPAARRGNLAVEIDLQVLRQSIAALAALPADLFVAANVTPATLRHSDLAETVRQWLQQAGVAPQRLHLEITETDLLTLDPAVRTCIEHLAALGVRWLIDDFGTGFSSISHLRDLPIHGIKLDRSFTAGIAVGDHKCVRLAQALSGLAEGLGLTTVAEGVETAAEAATMLDLGWSTGQGWYYGKAAPLKVEGAQPSWPQKPPPAASGSGSQGEPALRPSSWALAVTENVPVGLYALRIPAEAKPQFLFVSRRWLELMQLNRDAVLADSSLAFERIHPEDREAFDRCWRSCGAGREPLFWEGRLQQEGATTWVRIEGMPQPQADGSILWQGVLTNIDQEVVARRAMERDQARLGTTLDSLLDPHLILQPVRRAGGAIVDFRIIDANTAACADQELPREQLVGAHLLELLPAHAEAGLLERYIQVLESGEPLALNDVPVHHAHRGGDRFLDIRAVRGAASLSCSWRDVSDRYEAARRLAESEERYRLLAENSSDVVMQLGNDGIIRWVSPSLTTMLGWAQSEWIGQLGTEFLEHQGDAETYRANLEALQSGRSVVARDRIRDRSGIWHWAETHACPFRTASGDIDGIVAFFRTIDTEVEAEAALERQASTDALTGLPNRRETFRRLAALTNGKANAADSPSVALAFCDLDHFKQINDRHGHAAGDALLQCVGERLQRVLRRIDLVGRIGGDELLVMLVGVSNIKEALALAEAMRVAVREPVAIGATSVTTTLSIGITLCRPGESVDALVARADAAMYQAKQAGRDRVIPISAEALPAGGG